MNIKTEQAAELALQEIPSMSDEELLRVANDPENDGFFNVLSEMASAMGTRNGWRTMEEEPPHDEPILAYCVHSANEYYNAESDKLTPYGAYCEDVSHVCDGTHVVIWVKGEYMGYGYDRVWMPGWWFLYGTDAEVPANPVLWMPVPKMDMKSLDYNTKEEKGGI